MIMQCIFQGTPFFFAPVGLVALQESDQPNRGKKERRTLRRVGVFFYPHFGGKTLDKKRVRTDSRAMQDFSSLLKRELEMRIRANGAYSLRAFAKALDIDHSTLSKILRGKLPIRKKLRDRLGKRMGYTEQDLMPFQESSDAPDPESQWIDEDTFAAIKDWEHYAILSLVRLPEFVPSDKWVAKTLELPLARVREVRKRLIRVGLLKVDENGWQDVTDGHSTNRLSRGTSTAHRAHQRQVLQLALEALDRVDVRHRFQTSVTLPVSRKKMNRAKEMIANFRTQLTEFLSSGDELDEVYHVSFSLYPLTNVSNKEKKDE